MRLHDIIPSEGSTHPRKRVGRGHGSGHGKTSGRGHKGQKSRSGSGIRPGFESGHIPLYRKLPKRGFNNFNFRTDYSVVNVGDLANLEGVDQIDHVVLAEAGLIRAGAKLVKVLGDGEINSAVTVTANKFSQSAKEKIEKAGGAVVIVASTSENDSKESTD